MTANPHHFFLLSLLTLAAILLVFGMKSFAAARQSRLAFVHDGAYRGLAEQATSAQSAGAVSLAALQADIAEMKTRLAAVEKVLRDV